MIIASYTNLKDGVKAEVVTNDHYTFKVIITDIDSGHIIPTMRIFSDVAEAEKYAEMCVNF